MLRLEDAGVDAGVVTAGSFEDNFDDGCRLGIDEVREASVAAEGDEVMILRSPVSLQVEGHEPYQTRGRKTVRFANAHSSRRTGAMNGAPTVVTERCMGHPPTHSEALLRCAPPA